MTHDLTAAEKRCLRLSFKISQNLPQYPESIWASFTVSRMSTIESLHAKGYLIWSPHRGSTYHFNDKARAFVGAPSLTGKDGSAAS